MFLCSYAKQYILKHKTYKLNNMTSLVFLITQFFSNYYDEQKIEFTYSGAVGCV
jgi:hypothetical protein